MSETEVFRWTTFDPNKCYGFALYTRTTGNYPNQQYYTTKDIKYLGKWKKSERWGQGDGGGGAEIFEKDTIEYDYAGKTCFVELPCQSISGGKRKSRRNRKSKKSIKSKSRKSKSRKNRRKSNRRR